MNILEIINAVREDVLYDTKRPYKWSNSALLRCLTRAYDELCRETKCLIDSTTTAVVEVPLLSNTLLHALHASVVDILSARRESDEYPLLKKVESFMDLYFIGWRDTTGTSPIFIIPDSQNRYFSIYPKYDTTGYVAGDSDITFATGASNTVTKAGEDFTAHFEEDDEVVVTGTTSNNVTLTLTTVEATTLTVSNTLVAETLTSAVLKKVEDTALLRVARTVVTRWVDNDLDLTTPPTPEIDATYHYGLFDGIAKYAYLKQDSEAYDPNAAKRHADIFEAFKSDLVLEMMELRSGDTQYAPHYGAC